MGNTRTAITIHLPPGTFRRAQAAAARAGVSLPEFAARMLSQSLRPLPDFSAVLDVPLTALEPHGLSLRTLNTLEDQYGVCYLKQLKDLLDANDWAFGRTTRNGGPGMVAEIHSALRRYHAAVATAPGEDAIAHSN